jgi:HD-GYP domain-containing protein (c-di-GMP phosphodiesterase class II)
LQARRAQDGNTPFTVSSQSWPILVTMTMTQIATRGYCRVAEPFAPVVHSILTAMPPAARSLVERLLEKDEATCEHAVRVAGLAVRVGARAGLQRDRLQALGTAALLHDVGKLATPVALLNRAGPLSPDEYAVVARHPVDG